MITRDFAKGLALIEESPNGGKSRQKMSIRGHYKANSSSELCPRNGKNPTIPASPSSGRIHRILPPAAVWKCWCRCCFQIRAFFIWTNPIPKYNCQQTSPHDLETLKNNQGNLDLRFGQGR